MKIGRVISIGVIAVLGSVPLAACGGSTSSSSKSAAASGSDTTVKSDSGPLTSDDVNKVIGTLLEGATGARGDKVDGPGKVRFFNVLSMSGKPVDVDVYWGQPDEGAKVTTVPFGTVSDSFTPKLTKGFDSAVYSVTAKDTKTVLWTWDRFSPTKETLRTVIFMPSDDGTSFSESDVDEEMTVSSFSGKVEFPAPDAGMVRLLWRPLGKSLEQGENLLTVTDGTTCFTNGSGLAGPDGNPVDGSTFQVKPGTALSLTPFGDCAKTGIGGMTAPAASGRAILFTYVDAAGKPVMVAVPTQG